MPTIIPIDTPTLGDRSYLVHDGEVGFVVDPQRDIDRVVDLAAREQVRITHVFETHIHNDYVTGGLALAELTGAAYFVNAADDVSYARTPVRDGDELAIGASMRLRVLSTPGHTFTHLSYALSADGEPVAVFTGGSLLYGTTGRPDLLGPRHTHDLVHAQYASAQRLATELPDDAEVFPTHGFGSFCSATQSETTESTIGQEKRTNTVLTETEEDYVRRPARRARRLSRVLHAHDAGEPRRSRRAGPVACRRRLDPRSCGRGSRPASGWWTSATGRRSPPVTSPAPSTSASTASSPPTWAGSSTGARRSPCSARPRTTCNGPSGSWSASASTARPPPRPERLANGPPGRWSPSRRRRSPTWTRSATTGEVVILDVRRTAEFAKARIAGAINIPIHDLRRRVHEVPDVRGVGALRRRLPGRRRRLLPRRRRSHRRSPSTTPSTTPRPPASTSSPTRTRRRRRASKQPSTE